MFEGSPNEKKPETSDCGSALPAPLEPSNWLCQATSTRKRFFCRQRTLGPPLQGPPAGWAPPAAWRAAAAT